MPDLPRGHLRHFPVWYPPEVRLMGDIELLSGRTYAQRPDQDTRVISFWLGSFGQIRRRPGRQDEVESGHGAIDIYGGFGCWIHSTVDGHVVDTWRSYDPSEPIGRRWETKPGVGHERYPGGGENGGGHYVMVLDEDGYHHYYAHMIREPRVGVGDPVSAGELLGFVGASGLAQGSIQHLHYQVTRRRQSSIRTVNPYWELERLAVDTVPLDVSVSGMHFVQVQL